MLDQAEIEGLARMIYELAGLDPNEPVSMDRLVRHLPGFTGVRVGPFKVLTTGALTFGPRGCTIWCDRKAERRLRQWIIAHEIGEFFFAQRRDAYVEVDSDRLAAALLAPRSAVREMRAAYGHDAHKIASIFGLTQTCAWLRLGEVTDRPTLVVTPDNVYARGGGYEWSWGHEPRRLVRVATLPEGVIRVAITDARNRTALLAA